MLEIIISWFVILFVLFSFGDFFICLYNKLCKEIEQYSFIDTVLLGICFISIILPLSSFWLPSNHFILFAYIAIGLIHWLINRKRLGTIIEKLKTVFKSLSFAEKGILSGFIIIIILYLLFFSNFYDAQYYHYENIRWNEDYAVIPGLGNLEDRFGFNSNYLLISAIFTFRFIFTDATYSFQSLVFILLFSWSFIELVRSRFNIRYIILFLFLFLLFSFYGWMFSDSNTDVIPILCIFYYIIRSALKPDWYKSHYLFAFILPISMITFKLSAGLFSLASLFILIHLIKLKKYKVILCLLTASLFTIGFWCIRNVIITGYLVYPLYQIDLFSYDWKMPQAVTMLQKLHIYTWAKFEFEFDYIYSLLNVWNTKGGKIAFLNNSLNMLLLISVLASCPYMIYSIIKRKKVITSINIIYFISLICIILGFISAPNFRFMNGYVLGGAFLVIITLLTIYRKAEIYLPKTGKVSILMIMICCTGLTVKKYMEMINVYRLYDTQNLNSLLIKPWKEPVSNSIYTKYPLSNISIYITNDLDFRSFDKIPCTNMYGLPFTPFDGNKIQNIKTVEPRSNDIRDGFRTKKMYIDILNKNVDTYIKNYYYFHRNKYPKGFTDYF